jgi:hypothetical protein
MSLQTRVAAWTVHDACGIVTAPSECQSALDTNSCKVEAATEDATSTRGNRRRSRTRGVTEAELSAESVVPSWSLGIVSASAGQRGVARRPHTEPDGDVP